MNIVVLGGCGDMGSHVVRELLAHSEAAITIADYRLERGKELANELGERARAAFVDANDEFSCSPCWKGRMRPWAASGLSMPSPPRWPKPR